MRRRRWYLAAPLLSLTAGCSSGGGGDKSVGPSAGGFSISISAAAASVAQGAATTLTVTVTRTGSFAGAVTLAVGGLPNGVSAAFQPPQVAGGQTSSTLTLTANGAAAAVTAPFTVTGSAPGLSDQTASVSLTVTAVTQSGPFSLSLSVSSFLVLPPTALSWFPVLKIKRNAGFTGAVALSVTGLPFTLVIPVPPSLAGDSTTLIPLNIGAPNGTYTATIHGTVAGQGERTVSVQLVVASPTTGSVHWNFCAAGLRMPVWFFAVKDGAGGWTRLVPNADGTQYAFNVTQPTASVAMVTTDSGVARTTIYQYTAQEIAAAGASECALYPGVSSRTASGQAVGLVPNGLATVNMGFWIGSLGNGGSYSMQNLPPGPLDIVAFSNGVDIAGNTLVLRGIVRRGVNPPSGGMNALLDFGSGESFAMTTPTFTFGNTNGEAFSVIQMFATAGGTAAEVGASVNNDRTPTARTVYAIPASQTVAGDLHEVIATIGTVLPAGQLSRQAIFYARTLADRAITFGPTLPPPTVTVAGTVPGARLRAQGTLPAEYNSGVAFDVKSTGPQARFATLLTTRGFLGAGSAYDVQMPDLTAQLGWDSAWTMRAGDPTNWWVSGGGPALDFFGGRLFFSSTRVRWTGAATGIAAPTDGSTYLIGRARGTITPQRR
ncbi:MAG TPA: hypothetical protein VHE78_16080 [Gemmatimonadaceae bacterium]|nr:hypothetical protein [Gemmatimonadaceae bacterium]